MSINFRKFFCWLFGIGCKPAPPPPVNPNRPIAVIVTGPNGPIVGAKVTLNDQSGTTNQDGYFCFLVVPKGLTTVQVGASADHFKPFNGPISVPADTNFDIHLPPLQLARPAPINHDPLPPFDPNDSGGIVHTTLPPEQVIPPNPDPLWIRADFNGVTLNADRWGGLQKFKDAFLQGANSTPYTMIMTPMLIMYPQWLQDATLTEHAERGYSHIIVDSLPWNAAANGMSYTPSDMVAWFKHLRDDWGFKVFYWRGDPTQGLDTMFQTLIQAGVVDFYGHGEEVDRKMTSEAYEASLQQIDHYLGGKIPIGVHFTADGQRHMGYPIGMPRDTFLNDWSPYDGRVHLMQQLDQTASAGLQGASMYYARLHVNCGIGDAARGPGAPHSRIIAFETMATSQLYGQATEEYGCLRNWELICGTRTDPRCLPVSGFGNGCRRPDGSPI